jgi:hypothetical protein
MNSQFLTVQTGYLSSGTVSYAALLRGAGLAVLLGFSSTLISTSASAQGGIIDGIKGFFGDAGPEAVVDGPLMKPGNMAVTGFSGTIFPQEGLKPGVNPLDETFINLDGLTLRLFNIKSAGEAPKGQLVNTPAPFGVAARKIGQVFGLAYDNGTLIEDDENGRRTVPNLYVAASSMHGLQVVIPDNDDDDRPERVQKGEAEATFMEGQHGLELDGGPGSIYKIDGVTGEATLFANVQLDDASNSGAGLGNIAFDQTHQQLLVSDLDTGMIHRFDMEGNDLGHFDHGVDGRPNKGFDAAPHDAANRMDITKPSFDTANTETWGFTGAMRRVHGLAVKGNRLYYAVFEGLQIWSIGFNHDGNFASDARWELDVSSETDHAVTDIAFDRKGFMYLAQRGHVKNAYDYSSFAEPEKSQVLRYHRESPDDLATPSVWVETPAEFAVGFPEGHRMSVGGIDLGYGYDENGNINPRVCDGTLAKTGDNLRDNEALAEQLAAGGPFNVHGFQLTDKRLVRPENVPPFKSYFVDVDGTFDDPEVRGHVGDIEIWNPCRGGRSYGWGDVVPYPEDFPVPLPPGEGDYPKCVEVEWAEYTCNPGGFDAAIWLRDRAGIGADSLKVQSLKPGISVFPSMQTAAPGDPFWLDIAGAWPGEKVDINICYYKGSDAIPGKTFTCCQARLPLRMPNDFCAP